jgi:copper resistance protein C
MRTIAMTSKVIHLSIFLLTLILCNATVVLAHSFPEEESPPAGQTLGAPPAEVRIRFDARIEKVFATLQVLDAAGNDHTLGAPVVSANRVELTSKVDTLKPGEYTVKWAVVCVDTHHTEGSYSFKIIGGAD